MSQYPLFVFITNSLLYYGKAVPQLLFRGAHAPPHCHCEEPAFWAMWQSPVLGIHKRRIASASPRPRNDRVWSCHCEECQRHDEAISGTQKRDCFACLHKLAMTRPGEGPVMTRIRRPCKIKGVYVSQ